MSNIQIVHQLLSQVGIKFTKRYVRENGKGRWCHRLDKEHWEKLAAILHRRTERRNRLALVEAEADRPLGLTSTIPGGDQSPSSVSIPVSSSEGQVYTHDSDPKERWEWAIEDSA